MTAAARRRPARGFTLVEVLLALLAMALLSGFAWQALDGMQRAREAGRATVERSARLSTVLTQWEQDLQALYGTAIVPALAFDGQTLRLTRRVEGGVAMVAWSLRGGRWMRWVGPPTVRTGALQESWLRSQQLLGNEPGQLILAEGASEWQIYFFRGNAWSNAQSTGDLVATDAAPVAAAAAPPASGASAPAAPASAAAAPEAAREALPKAVRLVIVLDGRKLTRDIALGPGGA